MLAVQQFRHRTNSRSKHKVAAELQQPLACKFNSLQNCRSFSLTNLTTRGFAGAPRLRI